MPVLSAAADDVATLAIGVAFGFGIAVVDDAESAEMHSEPICARYELYGVNAFGRLAPLPLTPPPAGLAVVQMGGGYGCEATAVLVGCCTANGLACLRGVCWASAASVSLCMVKMVGLANNIFFLMGVGNVC